MNFAIFSSTEAEQHGHKYSNFTETYRGKGKISIQVTKASADGEM